MIVKKNKINHDRYNSNQDIAKTRSVDQTLEADDLINFEEQKKKILQNDENYHGNQAD